MTVITPALNDSADTPLLQLIEGSSFEINGQAAKLWVLDLYDAPEVFVAHGFAVEDDTHYSVSARTDNGDLLFDSGASLPLGALLLAAMM